MKKHVNLNQRLLDSLFLRNPAAAAFASRSQI